jgi:hypothetical protein
MRTELIRYHTINSKKAAELLPSSGRISDTEDMLELMANARYSDADIVFIHSGNLPVGFFKLSTGIAGEILQKFSNYRMELAIIGDFTDIKSKSLRQFIGESNRWGSSHLWGAWRKP